MTNNSLDFFLNISHAHASINHKLDDALGTLHGLSYCDFKLLYLLSCAEGGRMPVADFVRPLGIQLSSVIRQLVLLEKTGMVQRVPELDADGKRHVDLRPGGKKLLNWAIVTAEAICADALRTLQASHLTVVEEVLLTLYNSEALKL